MASHEAQRNRSRMDAFQVFVVAVLLLLPGLGSLLGVNSRWEIAEPTGSGESQVADNNGWLGVPARFDDYFDDNFGFRPLLVHGGGRIQFLYDPSKAAIAIGEEGWLFLGTEAQLPERHCVNLEARALEGWLELSAAREQAMSAAGTRFLWILAPAKHSLYEDFYPAELREELPDCELDQLSEAFHRAGRVSLLDLRSTFRDERRERRLFHRTDSHWNELGAILAAREIARKLQGWHPGIEPRDWRDFAVSTRRDLAGGNLSSLLSVFGKRFPEERFVASPRFQRRARPLDGSPAPRPGEDGHRVKRLLMGTSDPQQPDAVVFHDSFGYRLIPHLSEHFRKATFLHTTGPIDFPKIAEQLPEIVIYISSELKLLDPVPSDIGPGAYATFRPPSE